MDSDRSEKKESECDSKERRRTACFYNRMIAGSHSCYDNVTAENLFFFLVLVVEYRFVNCFESS